MIKKFVPHLVAVGIFTVLTVFYFLPDFQGMILRQGDIVQWKAMSKEIRDWNEQHPNDPALWTSRNFSGMPSAQISLVYPGNIAAKFMQALNGIFPDVSALMFLHFIGFYVLMLCLGINQWLAIIGSIAFGLSSFTLISIEAGHNTKVQAMALMAPVLGGVLLAYRKNIFAGAALTAFSLSLAIAANHLQVTYYLIMCVGLLGLYELIEAFVAKKLPHFTKATAMLVLAAALAIIPNIANLWMTRDYGKETIRGGSSELTRKKASTDGGLDFDYASRWSYGAGDLEFLSVLLPNIKGGGSGSDVGEESNFGKALQQKGYPLSYTKQAPTYWGNQPFTSGPVYFGAVVVFLFVFALLALHDKLKWWAVALSVVSFLLAFGHNTPFFKIAFNTLPFFNKFRTPSMALVIAQLVFPMLALLGLHQLLKTQTPIEKVKKQLLTAAGITGGIALLFGVFGSMFFGFSGESDKQLNEQGLSFLVDALKEDRASMLRSDGLRALFFIAAAFGLLWFFLQKKVSQTILIAGLGALMLIDSWGVDKRYLNDENFVEKNEYESAFAMTKADMDILRDTDANYRVYNLTRDPFNDAITSYYHKHIGGYHAAKLIRYQDLIEEHISKGTPQVLNMLNTRYVIQKGSDGQPQAQQNPGALGNAWLVKNIRHVKNADEEITALGAADFSPKETALLDERFKTLVSTSTYNNEGSTIAQTNFTPNKITYDYNGADKNFAVFSEVYYPEWNCYVDGKLTNYTRVDYVLRGLELPAGKHTIEFKIEPKAFVTGNKIAYAGSALLAIFLLAAIGLNFKQWQQQEAAEEKPTAKGKNK
ncbi:MAG: YfhO family protein [Chitinophagales bacterium]|nr:YfhO family protein [Chitinophagales bacterium]